MQRNETARSQLFARRAFLLGGIKIALMTSLLGRMYFLQILKSNEFKTLSDSNRIKHFVIPPLRGTITDRFGVAIALNRNYYRVLLDPEQSENKESTLKKLTTLLKTEPYKERYLLRKIKSQNHKRPIMLYDYLTWEEVAMVEVNSPDLPGVFIDVGQRRYYPYHHKTSHVIGYVGNVSEEEYNKLDPLFSHPDFKIGKSGIERLYEKELRGKAGIKRMEVNAHGLSIRELSLEESKAGSPLQLTLDVDLQSFVYEKLDNHSASCVVLNIHNGEILALCSSPGFDPNQFVENIQPEYWSKLVNDPYDPLVHKAIARTYPPGSTFKTIVSLAALHHAVIHANTSFHCPGYLSLGSRHFHCWRKEGHGTVNLRQALKMSCNVFFYQVALKLGIDKIAEMAAWLGLGNKCSDLPGEHPGLIANRAWKRTKLKSEWHPGDTLNCGVGQGFMQVTTLQLATLMARMAGGGRMITPYVYTKKEDSEAEKKMIPIAPDHFRMVLEGMNAVVNEPGGTAYGSRLMHPHFSMGGKTGTAQVVSLKKTEGGFVPWHERHHGLFIGFGPVKDPRYAIALIVEHEGGGSRTAAPLARDIMYHTQTRGC